MSSGLIVLLEISLILVLALGWAAFELIGLRRYRKRREREALELARLNGAAASVPSEQRKAALTDTPREIGGPSPSGEPGIKRA